MAQSYPDSLVLAIVSPSSAEDTRHNTDICGVIDTAGALSSKVEWTLDYIDTEIESKLAQVEQDIATQSAKLDAKIAEVQAVADSIVPPPIGSIKFSASQNVGEEWLKCDGQFVSESQYPELVEALGKLIPSGDKFQLISSGEIGPQISNGVLYGGRLWVYSYSTKKLYGVDVEGTAAVKEISVTSDDANFNDFIAPTVARPLVLSIVSHKIGTGARIFLAQIIVDGSHKGNEEFTGWESNFLIFGGEFSETESSISLSKPFTTIPAYTTSTTPYYTTLFDAGRAFPSVVSKGISGSERYSCMIGICSRYSAPNTTYSYTHIEWEAGSENGDVVIDTGVDNLYLLNQKG